jgi:hypothetical protein
VFEAPNKTVIIMRLDSFALRAGLALAALALCGAGVAFSQSVPPVPVDTTGSFWADLRDGVVASILLITSAVGLWLRPFLPTVVRSLIDMWQSSDSKDWEIYKRMLAEDAINSAISKTGLTPDKITDMKQKNRFIKWAVTWIEEHGKDFKAYADKNNNNVPDWLEVQLRKIAPDLPITPPPPAAAPPVRDAQSLMADVEASRVARQFVRKPKEAVQ